MKTFSHCGKNHTHSARAALLLAALGMAQPSMASEPAVSALNAKVDGFGGAIADDGAALMSGSVAAPLGHAFGVQVDALGGTVGGDAAFGGATHLFWRDPSVALLGLVGQRVSIDGKRVSRYGFEAEYYLSSFTIAGTGGWHSSDLNKDLYAGIDLRYYPTDNISVEFGASGYDDEREAHIGGEWRPGLSQAPGMSLFADGAIGNDDYNHILGGVRFYFGDDNKSLKRRHREDDPVVPMGRTLSNFVSDIANVAAPPPPPAATSGGGGGGGGGTGAIC